MPLQDLTWENLLAVLLVLVALATVYVLIGNVVETTRKLKKPKANQEADLTEHQRACEKKFRQDQAALENHGKRIDRLEEGQKVICAALHELLEHELHNGNAAAMKAASDNLFDYLNGK